MAISRPLLFALIGAIVLFAVVTAVRVTSSAREAQPSASQSASPTAVPPSAPTEERAVSTRGAATTGAETQANSPSQGSSRGSRSGREAAGVDAAHSRSRSAITAGEGVPAKVARALDDRRVVVLFFGAQGHDDRATRRAAEAVRGEAALFIASVYDLDEYARIVGALPLSQVPSTVVIDRKRKARVVEGFADAGTLRQLVADAR